MVSSIGIFSFDNAFAQYDIPVITEFTTDKTSYSYGETILISGHIENPWPNEPARMNVNIANGRSLLPFDAPVDSNRDFTAELIAGGPEWTSTGTYTLGVINESGSTRVSTTFQYTPPPLPDIVITEDTFITTDIDSYTYTQDLDIIISGNIGDLQLPITLEVRCDAMPTPSLYIIFYKFGTASYEVDVNGNFEHVLATLGFGCYKQTSSASVTIQGTNISTSFQMIGDESPAEPIVTITDILIQEDAHPSVTKMIVIGDVQNYDGQVDIEFYNDQDTLVGHTGWLSLSNGEFYGYVFEVVQNDGTWTTIVNLDDDTQLSESFYVEKRITQKVDTIPSIPEPTLEPVIEPTPEPVIEPTKEVEHDPVPIPETTPQPIPDSATTIIPALGSGAPGCEETSSGCYLPSTMIVKVGEVVKFHNLDTVVHTFTSGTPSDGPSDVFESKLLMVGNSYEWIPDTAGEFPYFCMVHPWMIGIIIVQDDSTYVPTPQPTYDYEPEVTKQEIDESVPEVSGYQGNVGSGGETGTFTLEEALALQQARVASANANPASDYPLDNDSTSVAQNLIKQDGKNIVAISKQLDPQTQSKVKSLDSKILREESQYDEYYKQYQYYEGKTLSSSDEQKFQRVIEKLNSQNEKIISLIDERNVIVLQSDDLSELIGENKKLREGLERQGEQIDDLNKEVDMLKQIIQSIQGFFSSVFG